MALVAPAPGPDRYFQLTRQALHAWDELLQSSEGAADRSERIRALREAGVFRFAPVAPAPKAGLPKCLPLVGGRTAWQAAVDSVKLRTVACTYGGATVRPQDLEQLGHASSHVKAELKKLVLKERRLDPATGSYCASQVTLTARRKTRISFLVVEVNGEEFDLVVDGDVKLQFLFAPCVATPPVQARLSLRYTSPLGGEWFVQDHPIDLSFTDDAEASKSRMCAVM